MGKKPLSVKLFIMSEAHTTHTCENDDDDNGMHDDEDDLLADAIGAMWLQPVLGPLRLTIYCTDPTGVLQLQWQHCSCIESAEAAARASAKRADHLLHSLYRSAAAAVGAM